ncbi:MAG: hypothetical protein LBU14_00445 [Candidatus Peribacteria bacterium]|nr:hypothetical protein [Candidatus Peribacteria bacterium]
MMKTDNYKELSNYFFTLENDLNIEISYLLDNLFVQNNVLNDENFQYIISKLFSDDYYKNIKNTSLATGVDEKLIMSAI